MKSKVDDQVILNVPLKSRLFFNIDYPIKQIISQDQADLPSLGLLRNEQRTTHTSMTAINSMRDQSILVQKQYMWWTLMLGIGTLGVAFVRLLLLLRNRRKVTNDDTTDHLKVSGNEVFKEVVELAKNNDPAFLGRFKEVYPAFCKDLCERYPGILNSELTFCAYLKLNFTTKDIAAYTFVTPSAVRNRKNRMKKKFGIPAYADIYTWVDKIASSQAD
ncbi:hypothetical protein GCM10022218_02660 [Sphingobacterium ginsenosidimutans]|uniref:HTH luxR-type domain-containing protein n=2 Tax=Sphingobacterium ginsenosidimutans TaxID=687845 RepID=A0ABP7ZQP9_9SPHI